MSGFLVDEQGRPIGNSIEAKIARLEAATMQDLAETMFGVDRQVVLTDATTPRPEHPPVAGLAALLTGPRLYDEKES